MPLTGRWQSKSRAPVIVAAAAVLVLAACDPIPHTEFVQKEAPESPTKFELLSGDGNFVVVRSTGASDSVPGAGRWRIDRRDGSTVALPTSSAAGGISRDGSRVLLTSGGATIVWSNGATLTPPAGTLFSDDLTFGVFVDIDGAVKTWETATQAVGLVETDFPRPPGTTVAFARGISDDGRTVQYRLDGPTRIERFVDLDAVQAVDRANNDGGGDSSFVKDRFVLAAEGTAFAHLHEAALYDIDFDEFVITESWVDLVDVPSGALVRRYTNTSDEGLSTVLIAGNGQLVWIYRERSEAAAECHDGGPSTNTCTTSSHAVAMWTTGARTFDTGPRDLIGIDISHQGRYLLLDKQASAFPIRGPVQVLDWLNGTVEHLNASGTYTESHPFLCAGIGQSAPCAYPAASTNGQVSDDLQVVATTTKLSGWYEYSAAP